MFSYYTFRGDRSGSASLIFQFTPPPWIMGSATDESPRNTQQKQATNLK